VLRKAHSKSKYVRKTKLSTPIYSYDRIGCAVADSMYKPNYLPGIPQLLNPYPANVENMVSS